MKGKERNNKREKNKERKKERKLCYDGILFYGDGGGGGGGFWELFKNI